MFWNKIKKCKINNKLPECNSISKIRDYQERLNKLDDIGLEDIIIKYFNIDYRGYYSKQYFALEEALKLLISQYDVNQSNYFEIKFKMFGKEIDELAQKDNIINSLSEKIKTEKEKLGIK